MTGLFWVSEYLLCSFNISLCLSNAIFILTLQQIALTIEASTFQSKWIQFADVKSTDSAQQDIGWMLYLISNK